MNRKAVVCTVLALSVGLGGVAFAQRDEPLVIDVPQNRRGNEARPPHRPKEQGRPNNLDRRDGRGVGPEHRLHRGDRLPASYRHKNYVVNDWRRHHLNAPPRGHHGIQIGPDYALVVIATGVIVQLVLHN